MTILANTLSVISITLFTYALFSSWILRYHIDEEKLRNGNYRKRIFIRTAPPFEILTETGVKVWRSKWIAICLALIAIFFSIYFFEKADETGKSYVEAIE